MDNLVTSLILILTVGAQSACLLYAGGRIRQGWRNEEGPGALEKALVRAEQAAYEKGDEDARKEIAGELYELTGVCRAIMAINVANELGRDPRSGDLDAFREVLLELTGYDTSFSAALNDTHLVKIADEFGDKIIDLVERAVTKAYEINPPRQLLAAIKAVAAETN